MKKEPSKMIKHFLQVKENYKDCIVFYRLGDFYEMFFEDAIKASALLDLTLTGKDCGMDERAPMCGVPYHAADMYISKLVEKGEKVAICEQIGQPNGKNLVEREVVKIITAGTVINNELIDEKSNNFLGAVYIYQKNVSFAWADITTGEFYARSFSGEQALSDLLNCLTKISPVEIIANTGAEEIFREAPLVKFGVLPKFNQYSEGQFEYNSALKALKEQFGVVDLKPFGVNDDDCLINSSGALISYLKETQRHALINFKKISVENLKEYMMLDSTAIRNLELTATIRDGKRYGSLLWLLDKTCTSMGARKLQSWILSPLGDIDKINYRLSAVESLYNSTITRQGLTELLGAVRDISRISGKISNGNLTPKDCLLLRSSLEVLPNVKFQLSGINSEYIYDLSNKLGDFSSIVSLLFDSIAEDASSVFKDGGYIKSGYNQELDELRELSSNGKKFISELEKRERERTQIKNLRISYNRVFGYYIEVTNSFKSLVPYEYQRRQTLANAERYITEELKELEVKILSAEERSIQLESKIYGFIKEQLSQRIEDLLNTADALAELDAILSLATVARNNSYVKPEIVGSYEGLNIIEGRHPVVEAISKERFVANDCSLDNNENRTAIVTGPNMAGKSTYMRQVALITLMAQIGSFVPAKCAKIPVVDRIFTRIGASDSLISDQSTFMVEMAEMANIICNATDKSLLILDEIGRGTSTFDGLSIAWAIVEHLNGKIRAKTLFATHYHELTELEGKVDGIKNYKVTVKEIQGGIVFLRKIMRGSANRSFGIEVAQLAGVDKGITERAKEILKSLEHSDINKCNVLNESDANEKALSEVERIIKDIDINNLSPLQAFNIISDLKEKV